MRNELDPNEALHAAAQARAAASIRMAAFAKAAPVRHVRKGWFRRLLGA